MEFYIVMTVVLFAIGLWNLMIAILGLFPQCRAMAVGTLANAKHYKNYRGNRNYIICEHLTRSRYVYAVGNRQYRTRVHNTLGGKRKLLKKVSVIHVKWFPRHGYINSYTGFYEWFSGILFLFFGCAMIHLIIRDFQ